MISIAMLTFNGGEKLKQSIRSIKNQICNVNYEIVALDSGSTDGSIEFLRENCITIFSIKSCEFNFGLSRDYLFSLTKGDVIVTLSQDVIPTNNKWLENIIKPFENSKVAVVQGIESVPDNDKIFYWERIGKFYFTRDSKKWESKYQFGMSFTNCAIRKSVWIENKIGSMQMNEDKIFQKKISEKKLIIEISRNAVCYHYHDYDIKSLIKRCLNEGMGWRYVDIEYNLKDVILDCINYEIITTCIKAVLSRKINRIEEILFPVVRPMCLFIGNRFVNKYLR